MFEAEIDNDIARRLAACWYYTATEVEFGNEDDEVDSKKPKKI